MRLKQTTVKGTNILSLQPDCKNQEYFLESNVAFQSDFY